jgi:ribokinase
MVPERPNERRADSRPTGVIVLGSLNMDLSVTVTNIPSPGETVLAQGITQQPGGKGANQAVAAARLGGDVHLIGRLGRDALGDRIRAVLTAANVDLTHVRDGNLSTGQAYVTVDANGENAIVVSSGANAEMTPDAVEQEAAVLRSAAIAVTQLETPLDAVTRFATLCHESGVDLVLNAAPFHPLPRDLLTRCRYLVLNRDEAQSLTGISVSDQATASDALIEARRLGADGVVITLGGQGCVALAEQEVLEIDPFNVEVIDTTGAGDAFVGALAVALAREEVAEDALVFAAAAGATACTRRGGQSLTSPRETQELLRTQRPAVRRRPAPQPQPATANSPG